MNQPGRYDMEFYLKGLCVLVDRLEVIYKLKVLKQEKT